MAETAIFKWMTKLGTILKKPWVILLVTGLLILVSVTLSINQIMLALLHARPEVVVPNLEGQSLLDSLGQVSHLKLSLRQEGTEFDESLPAGTIVRQHPPSGMKVRAGRAINVIVSKGGRSCSFRTSLGNKLKRPRAYSLWMVSRWAR